jgi:hypothetical protein
MLPHTSFHYGDHDTGSALPALAGQLTRLEWSNWKHESSVTAYLSPPAVLCKLSKLQHLLFDGFAVDDVGLRLLLTDMPALKHVCVRTVELQSSHADNVGCSWEVLNMRTVSVTSLAHLPLRGIKRVCVDELVSTVTAGAGNHGDAAAASDDNAAAAVNQLSAALAAAPDCAFSCWQPDVGLKLHCSVSKLPILLPLLARWHGVLEFGLTTLSGEQLTSAAVVALGALLEGMPSCKYLSIAGAEPHPSAQLLPALASSNVKEVLLNSDRMTDAHLMMWCKGGNPSRPVTVRLDDEGEFVGSIRRVLEAVSVPDSGVKLEGWRRHVNDNPYGHYIDEHVGDLDQFLNDEFYQ